MARRKRKKAKRSPARRNPAGRHGKVAQALQGLLGRSERVQTVTKARNGRWVIVVGKGR